MNIASTKRALDLMRNVFDTNKQTVSPISFPQGKPLFEPCEKEYFQRVQPEECGISSEVVKNFVSELWANEAVGLQCIMLMRGNKVFFEADVGNQDGRYPKATFSECKSVIAIAIGKLVTQGKLRLSEKISDIFADRLTAMGKMRLKGLSVKHLLTMTAGITFNELETTVSSNWVKSYLDSDIDGDFGKNFRYNSLNSYMLAAIITMRAGMSVSDYLRETVFKDLDITDFYWEKCPNGIERGGWGLYIRREDLAKLGLLVLQNGIWNGKKVINSKYITDMTRMQAEVPMEYGDYNYGFHTWCGRETNSFLFNGMLGQNLLCFKHSGIMIIANCSNCDLFQQNDFFRICEEFMGGIFVDILPENTQEFDALCSLKRKMKLPLEINSFLPGRKNCRCIHEDINAINGKRFAVKSENRVSVGVTPVVMQCIQCNYTEGLKEIGFYKNGDDLEMHFVEENQTHIINIGFGNSKTSNIKIGGDIFTVSCIGEFCENEDGIPMLKVYCDFVETPYSRCFKFYFQKGKYSAVLSEMPADSIIKNPDAFNRIISSAGAAIKSLVSKIDLEYITVKAGKVFAPELILEEITQ